MSDKISTANEKDLNEMADAFLAGGINREELIERAVKLKIPLDLLDLVVTSRAHVSAARPKLTEKKAIYLSFIQEVFNEGRIDKLDTFLSPAYVYRDAPPGTPAGAEGIKQIVSMFRTAFPDLRITIEQQVAEDDVVCSRTTMRGTHKGPLFGVSATGNTVTVPGLTMVRIVNGRLVESWVKNDVTSLMKQLGVNPSS